MRSSIVVVVVVVFLLLLLLLFLLLLPFILVPSTLTPVINVKQFMDVSGENYEVCV